MDKRQKFINIYAYVLLLAFLGCLITIYYLIYYTFFDQSYQRHHNYLLIASAISAVWYLLGGLGLLKRKKWGYYLFKSFLYFFLISFPVGTIISYKSLKYMKRSDIKALFS